MWPRNYQSFYAKQHNHVMLRAGQGRSWNGRPVNVEQTSIRLLLAMLLVLYNNAYTYRLSRLAKATSTKIIIISTLKHRYQLYHSHMQCSVYDLIRSAKFHMGFKCVWYSCRGPYFWGCVELGLVSTLPLRLLLRLGGLI